MKIAPTAILLAISFCIIVEGDDGMKTHVRSNRQHRHVEDDECTTLVIGRRL